MDKNKVRYIILDPHVYTDSVSVGYEASRVSVYVVYLFVDFC